MIDLPNETHPVRAKGAWDCGHLDARAEHTNAGATRARMELKDFHRRAVESGFDDISIALGHVEARLKQNPADRRALIYKGALLTLAGEELLTADKRRDYMRLGAELIEAALDDLPRMPECAAEMLYVAAGTFAVLPEAMGHDKRAAALFDQLLPHDDFDTIGPYQQARALALAACLAQQRGDAELGRTLFRQARAIDLDWSVRSYSDFLERN